MIKKIVITGGAGFVGSNLALAFRRDWEGVEVVVLDNLKRRGSELILQRLREGGIQFYHGDVRQLDDLQRIGPFDLLIECSAEPSVCAGYGESPSYLIQTNLSGAIHCLEVARQHQAKLIFLSSSRVYPIEPLCQLPLETKGNRFAMAESSSGLGWSAQGISETFPLTGYRSLYGTTKLAAELLIEEYAFAYGLESIINRCGVLTGPWQMGKVDQGFVVLWAARHYFGGSLSYMGFGGEGHQVRDILHVMDLYDLLLIQLRHWDQYQGATYNVGGGIETSVSLAELTDLCAHLTGRKLSLDRDPKTRTADIPYYVTDYQKISQLSGWRPQRSVATILEGILVWLHDYQNLLRPVLT